MEGSAEKASDQRPQDETDVEPTGDREDREPEVCDVEVGLQDQISVKSPRTEEHRGLGQVSQRIEDTGATAHTTHVNTADSAKSVH